MPKGLRPSLPLSCSRNTVNINVSGVKKDDVKDVTVRRDVLTFVVETGSDFTQSGLYHQTLPKSFVSKELLSCHLNNGVLTLEFAEHVPSRTLPVL